LQPLLEPQGRQNRALGVVLLRRWEAEHDQHPLAHHWLDSSAIPLGPPLGQVIQRAYLLVEGIEIIRLTRPWS
jgi:hypothetical protein